MRHRNTSHTADSTLPSPIPLQVRARFSEAFTDMTEAFLAFPLPLPGTQVWKGMQGRRYILSVLRQAAELSKQRMCEGSEPDCLLDFWSQGVGGLAGVLQLLLVLMCMAMLPGLPAGLAGACSVLGRQHVPVAFTRWSWHSEQPGLAWPGPPTWMHLPLPAHGHSAAQSAQRGTQHMPRLTPRPAPCADQRGGG